jgi:hypothetical protein
MTAVPPLRGRPGPEPVCRRTGCGQAALAPHAFCLECGLRYLRWRAERDERERHDLAGTGRGPGDALDDEPELARALDLLHLLFTREPFA